MCDLDKNQMREYRGTLTAPGKNSPYRDRSIEENLELFERMKNGEFEDGSRTLRAKIDMASPNINMRDPAIYRILHLPHHQTGNKWCIYPMYDFAHPIQDAIEKVTHSLCSLEYEAHRPLYNWVIDACEFEHKPRQIEFARLNMTNTIMSKRYLRRLVDCCRHILIRLSYIVRHIFKSLLYPKDEVYSPYLLLQCFQDNPVKSSAFPKFL